MISSFGSSIRELDETWIAEIQEIEQCSFPKPWSVQAMLDEFRSPFVFVFGSVKNEELQGYAFASCVESELTILSIAVRQQLRGEGIGSELLRAVITEAIERGAQQAYLEVRISNESAKRLYQRFGFRTVYTRARYYTDNLEDALVLEAKIEHFLIDQKVA